MIQTLLDLIGFEQPVRIANLHSTLLAHLSETQKRALIIADNRIAMNAGWDEEMLRLELTETVLVDSFDTVASRMHALKALGVKVGVAARRASAPGLIRRASREARAFVHHSDNTDLEVRGFAAPIGVAEDPVTGSLNASLAQWLIEDGHMPSRYRARQGTALGRAGKVFVQRDAAGQVWIGGDVVGCIRGEVTL